jgi:hypothetical protein
MTRGRSSSGPAWMSNLSGNIKSAFSKIQISANSAVDQLEQKLSNIESPSSPTPVQNPPSPDIDPAEIENIAWVLPDSTQTATAIEGKSLECRFLGSRKSGLSEAEAVSELIQKCRAQYQVPTPPLCGITLNSSAIAIYPVDQKEKQILTNLIKLIPIGGDISGLLVDRDEHAEVWILQGLDITIRLQELLKAD